MKKFQKILVLGITMLFVGTSIVLPVISMKKQFSPDIQLWEPTSRNGNDTTPPVTTISFDPPMPDGVNGWFVSDVTIILNATDDMSGVNATYYRLNEGEWETYTEPFVIQSDGHCLIEYYSVDNVGNEEDVKSFAIKIDQTSPDIVFYYWPYKERGRWYITYTVICSDATSGINRVELYINDGLVSTDDKEPYEWTFQWSDIFRYLKVKAVAFDQAGNSLDDSYPYVAPKCFLTGLICNPEVINQSITFFAILVLEISYSDSFGVPFPSYHLWVFKRLTIPNDYTGYIGRFFIRAGYYDW